ncbi:MAG: FAD-dependent oxidoreductase, partial [Rhodothermaceae bacterium]|nr:FAD-dependent oxidoreductase [Rhodothermaceae bacterium]
MKKYPENQNTPSPKKVAIVGAGISGLGAAWALSKQPDQFDFRVFEAQDQIGGNA